jgi:hypothetical protein
MYKTPGRLFLGLLLAGAAASLGACGHTPAELGITGPSPGQSLTPPAPTMAETNPDATPLLPGVRTGEDPYAPSVLMGPTTTGKFYGSD